MNNNSEKSAQTAYQTTLNNDGHIELDGELTLGPSVTFKGKLTSDGNCTIETKPISETMARDWLNEPGHNEESWESRCHGEFLRYSPRITVSKQAHSDGVIYIDGVARFQMEVKTDKTGGCGIKNKQRTLLQNVGSFLKQDKEVQRTMDEFLTVTPKYVCHVPIVPTVRTFIKEVARLHKKYPNISPSQMWSTKKTDEFRKLAEALPPYIFKSWKTKDISIHDFFSKFISFNLYILWQHRIIM